MTKDYREIHQLLEGARFYLDLAKREQIPDKYARIPLGELQELEASRSCDYALFRKGAHLNSAAIRICTAYEIIEGDQAVHYRIKHTFYTRGGKALKGNLTIQDVHRKIQSELPRFIAYLLRDSISHRESDSSSDDLSRRHKRDYLFALTSVEVENALCAAFNELVSSWIPNTSIDSNGSANES